MVCFSMSLIAQTTVPDEFKTKIRTFVAQEMKKNKVTGLSIALVKGNEVLWTEGFGYANLINQKKCDDSTLYRAGSVSKLFTATAIMQLVEAGKLNLDAPITEVIPEFSIGSNGYDVNKITIRRLLTHKSGLPSDVFRGLFDPTPDPIDSIIPYLKNENLTNDPGTIFSYSNPGFTLLGYIVQRVSGMPFEAYMEENILTPLEMNNSAFTISDKNRDYFSDGFTKNKTSEEPVLFELPAGLLHTSSIEISHFMIMVLNNGTYAGKQILKEETLRQMLTVQTGDNKLDFSLRMGLSWFLHDKNSEWEYAGGAAEHGGDTYLYHTQLTVLPEAKIGVVVLTNSTSGVGVARSVTKEILQKAVEQFENKKAPEEKTPEIWFEKDTANLLPKLAGGYTMGPDYLEFTAREKFLFTKQQGIPLCFIPNNLGTYTPAVRLLGFIRIPLKKQQIHFKQIGGQMYMTYISGKDTSLLGLRTEVPAATPEWKAMAGNYEGIDTHEFSVVKKITIKEANGKIQMLFSGWNIRGKATLIPQNTTQAAIVGVGRQTGSVVKILGDNIYFSGIIFKKIEKK
jgi:CubicO group peptidase (beta-lactamase class C family)